MSELFEIFERQLKQCGWTVDKKVLELFNKEFKKFKNAGGDCENLCFQAKLQYSKNNWMKKRQSKRLSFEHVKNAIASYFKEEVLTNNTMYI